MRRIAGLLTPTLGGKDAGRFFLLDGGRALAACAVLFWHYQHFFVPINQQQPVDYLNRVPMADIFALFYAHGEMAVPVFWMMSGFVFAHVYLGERGTTSEFAANRFARLYPLHLLTLLVTAVLQALATARFGAPQIFQQNDGYHFVLQLFLASAWGLEEGHSFNAPIWSISAEIPIYALFWICHRWLARYGVALPLLIAVSLALATLPLGPRPVLVCGYYFFTGTALYILYRKFREERWALFMLAALVGASGAGALEVLAKESPLVALAVPMLFGGVILAVALLDASVPARAHKSLAAVGDSTYGIYLWHFPVQLMFFLIFGATISSAAESPAFLALFVLVTLVVSRAGYVWFERPMRNTIRRLANAPQPRARISAP